MSFAMRICIVSAKTIEYRSQVPNSNGNASVAFVTCKIKPLIGSSSDAHKLPFPIRDLLSDSAVKHKKAVLLSRKQHLSKYEADSVKAEKDASQGKFDEASLDKV
jgi:hypothetical protein